MGSWRDLAGVGVRLAGAWIGVTGGSSELVSFFFLTLSLSLCAFDESRNGLK